MCVASSDGWNVSVFGVLGMDDVCGLFFSLPALRLVRPTLVSFRHIIYWLLAPYAEFNL